MSRRMVTRFLVVGVLVLVALLVLSFPGAFYRRHEEIDIRSGRVRLTSFVLFWKTKQQVVESPLSQVIPSTTADAPDWHFANTFEGWSRVSPHYAYHSAIAQTRHLAQLWQMVPFSPEAKHQVATNVLKLWQADGGYWSAERYIFAVDDAAFQHQEQSKDPVSAVQLPSPSFSSPGETHALPSPARPLAGPRRTLRDRLESSVSSNESTFDFAADSAFRWDRMFVFGPYSGQESVEKSLGFKWHDYHRTSIESSDSVCLVVFVQAGKVVHWYEQPRTVELAGLANGKGYRRPEAVFKIERTGGRAELKPSGTQ